MNGDKRKYGINIQYFSQSESYEPYEMNVDVKLDSDITAGEAIIAFVKVMRAAGFNITYETLEQIALDMKDGYR